MALRRKRRVLLCHSHPSASRNPQRAWVWRWHTIFSPAVTPPPPPLENLLPLPAPQYPSPAERSSSLHPPLFCPPPAWPPYMFHDWSGFLPYAIAILPRSPLLLLHQIRPPLQWTLRCSVRLLSRLLTPRRCSSPCPTGSWVCLSFHSSSFLDDYLLS